MTADPSDHEALLEFVYQIPFGVAQLLPDGSLGMSNPVAMQLVLQVAQSELNLFKMLSRFAPEVELLVREFEPSRGTIVEDYRVDFGTRSATSSHPLVLAFTIIKLGPERTMVTMVDVSRSVAAERCARTAESRLKAMEQTVRDYAVFGLDPEGRVLGWNLSAQRLFALEPEEASGRPGAELVSAMDASAFAQALERARRLGWATIEGTWRRLENRTFPGTGIVSVVEDERGGLEGFTCVVRDQSDAAEESTPTRSRDRDQHGLLAREAFDRVEPRLLASTRRSGHALGVLVLELDRFESMVDRIGESGRHEAFELAAKITQANLRVSDSAIHYEPGRIVVLMPDSDLRLARLAAERIRSALEQRVLDTGEALVKVTASAGVTVLEEAEAGLEAALERARTALAKARRRGYNTVVVGHSSPGGAPAQSA